MQLRQITVIPLTAPYIRADTPADHPSNGLRNCVWVRIDTEDGRSGWGEAYSGCYATEVTIAALHRVQRAVQECRSDDPAQIMREVRFRNRYWAMRGIGAGAISAIESAVYDLYAQKQGKPLWQVLGGDRPAGRVLAYASAGDNSFSADEIYTQARRVRKAGFRAYKLRCGGNLHDPPEEDRLARDVDRVAAAREAMGPDASIFVDVGVPQRRVTWPAQRAEQYLRALSPYRIGFLEEPAMTYDVKGYAALQRLGLAAIAGGESFTDPEEFVPFFEAQALGVAQPDAAVVGGPASAVAVCRMAQQFGVPVCLHAWSAGVGIAQNLHAAWACANVMAIEWPISQHPPQTEPLAGLVSFQDGYLLASNKPGLAAAVSDQLLERYPYRPGCDRDF
ncbi:MAG TPA: mandelate racemase/muconate lactonizing enzyme family protein [Tepidisphaeraceae bacterium]|nr:mandelate racemase/muconate lactonizing enzyme family protein [Tepidisphaeraceae bacterium]